MWIYFISAFFGFVVGEALSRIKLKFHVVLLKNKNLLSIFLTRQNPYGTFVTIGKRTMVVHHSFAGIVLAGVAIIISNLLIFLFSLGIIFHHFLKYRAF